MANIYDDRTRSAEALEKLAGIEKNETNIRYDEDKRIANALEKLVSNGIQTGGIMSAQKELLATNPRAIESLIESGVAQEIFAIGDLIYPRFARNGRIAYFPYRLVHIGDAVLQDGTVLKDRMFFESVLLPNYTTQFCNNQAFMKCPDGLSAGTYTIHFSEGVGSFTSLAWSFTLTKAIPVGGKLAGFKKCHNLSSGYNTITSYAANSKTVIETVTASADDTGTDLGTIFLNSTSGNLNSLKDLAYGKSGWANSLIRRSMNTNSIEGLTADWWEAVGDWDIIPSESWKTSNGALVNSYLEEFFDILKEVKVETAISASEKEVTFDKVFIPSLTELGMTGKYSDEGTCFDYYKDFYTTVPSASSQWTVLPNSEAVKSQLDAAVSSNYVIRSFDDHKVFGWYADAPQLGSSNNLYDAYPGSIVFVL